MPRWSVTFANDIPTSIVYRPRPRERIFSQFDNAEAAIQLSNRTRIRVHWNGAGANGFTAWYEELTTSNTWAPHMNRRIVPHIIASGI